MYIPAKDGIEKEVSAVRYSEAAPSSDISDLVYCFWELKTDGVLTDDFYLHATPDACVDIMFNERNENVAGVTSLRTTYEILNLGKDFHYVGIQFYPGVWRGSQADIAHEYIGEAYRGTLPLLDTNRKMITLDFQGKQEIMSELVRYLAAKNFISVHEIIASILSHVAVVRTVADMARVTNLSTRQLQRVIKQATGFTPHDFLKIIRLQESFIRPNMHAYADQAHFIRSFREVTGYTPGRYQQKFS